jgi:CO/xanthine dehydrogenase FAD-binding subunit
MEYLQPMSLDEACQAKALHPSAVVIAGGTDVMVEVNFDRLRPEALLDLSFVEELRGWSLTGSRLRIGARVTYSEIVADLSELAPALALASRTVGSPQIRNRGTVGGNLGSSSPAGDALPPLVACDAMVELASQYGKREVPIEDFCVGVKRNSLRSEELITAVSFDAADGPQQFAKIGTRNAMVIAVASLALVLRPNSRSIKTGLGSVAPRPLRATEAEQFLEAEMRSGHCWERRSQLSERVVDRFAELVAGAARPIDDVRGTASYRAHALRILAGRTLSWAWGEYMASQPAEL